jgi:PAS domain S-box-containing protein
MEGMTEYKMEENQMNWSNDHVGVFRATVDGKFTTANQVLAEMCGFSSIEEFMKNGLGERYACPKQKMKLLAELRKKEIVCAYKIKMRKKDGTTLWTSLSCKLFCDEYGEPQLLEGIVEEIGDRKREKEKLEESQEKFHKLFDMQPNGIIILDAETHRFDDANQAALDLYGYSKKEFLTLTAEEISAEKEKIMGVLQQLIGKVQDTESYTLHDFRQKEGNVFTGEMTAGDFTSSGRKKIMLSVRDLSYQKNLEDEIAQAQKLSTIGILAGSIAHDFNNILNIVIGFGTLIEEEMEQDNPSLTALKLLVDTAHRGTHLTQNLLSFSRKQTMRPEHINVNDIVYRMKEMLPRIIGEGIELKFTLLEQDLPLRVDAGQIEQVLINLAGNARDAMLNGGVLHIKTKSVTLNERSIQTKSSIDPGRYVLISVTDSGSGMDDVTRQKLFEPFFTTKDNGKGTGLGLAIVHGIIMQHRGHINVESKKGEGSTFEIYLPVT